MQNNYLEKNIETKCPICGIKYMTAKLNIDPCPNCGWYNDLMCEEHEDEVIYRNLVSLNKAKRLYAEGKPLAPSLEDFLDALNFYGEMEFKYKDFDCALFRTNDQIEFVWGNDSVTYLKDKDDFIQNAKIGNEYVRDIWDKVENPSYM